MKKITIVFLFLMSLFPVTVLGQTSFMTYNIRYNNPNDGVNWWGHRKSEVSEMINYYAPEIIGIQEGLENQVKYLDSTLVDYNYVGVGRDDGKLKGEFTAVFYKKECYKIRSTKTYWLSETPNKVSIGWDASMERIVTFVEFLDLKTNETLYVFNCHYDHKGRIAQKKSSELLLQIIDDKKIDDQKIIVMGDFNAQPNDEPIKTLKKELIDHYNKSGVVSYGPLGTFNQFATDKLIERRIDYILTKNITVKTYIHIDDRRKNNLFLSDHLPVMIKVE